VSVVGGLEAGKEAENSHILTHMFEWYLFLASSTACLCYPPCFPGSRLFGITLGAGGKLGLKCVRVGVRCKKPCTAVVRAKGQLASLPENLLTFPRCPKPSMSG